MAARRTQIYLDDETRARIDRLTARDGRTMAQVVREALDNYLTDEERVRLPLTEVAAEAIGAWAGQESHLPELRREYRRRAQRLRHGS